LEEVDFVGGGVLFWRKCFLVGGGDYYLEEVDFIGGDVYGFWSRVALTGLRTNAM